MTSAGSTVNGTAAAASNSRRARLADASTIGRVVWCRLGFSVIVPLALLGIREYKSPTQGRDYREGPLGRLVVWLGGLPARIAPALIVASIVIFVGGIVVEDDLTLQTDPVEWVNQDSDVIANLDTLEAETGSSSELGMFFRSDDVFSDETVRAALSAAGLEQRVTLWQSPFTDTALVVTRRRRECRRDEASPDGATAVSGGRVACMAWESLVSATCTAEPGRCDKRTFPND